MPPSAFAQENYPIAFDRDASRTRTDRVLNGIVLNGNIFQVKMPMKMYHDLTDQTFYAHAGDIVSPSPSFTAGWMDSYIYIDKDNNGAFDVLTPGVQGALTEDNELVSFSGLTLPDGAYNSYGEKTDLSQVQPPADSPPKGGEIDIFEAIDAQNTAFHTLHSHWINTLAGKNNPKYSFSESVTQGEWHVFAANRTEDLITFYVDGNPVGSYAKSQNASDLEQGQWPFLLGLLPDSEPKRGRRLMGKGSRHFIHLRNTVRLGARLPDRCFYWNRECSMFNG